MPNINDFIDLGGWVDNQKSVQAAMQGLPMPLFSDHSQTIKGSSKGKIRLLHEYVSAVLGNTSVLVGRQLTGDCVSWGAAGAVNVLSCVEIAMNGEMESIGGLCATEPIYGGSRIQIGDGQLGNGQGSVGAWAARWVNEFGVIVRRKYTEDNIDLSEYDVNKATTYGSPGRGCPQSLIKYAKEHKVNTVSQIRTFQECCDAIYNGFPVTVASNVGFNQVRDKYGRLFRSGNWAHQMYFSGMQNTNEQPGVFCINSWGDSWVSGPKRYDSDVVGGFWIDAETVDIMLSQNDSWCFSNFSGFPVQDLDWGIM